jgi:hypothetical protein
MHTAELVAQKLAAKFLEEGLFTATTPMKHSAAQGLLPASASPGIDVEEFYEEQGFAGLAVQAVGHEQGSDHERVHIYVAKGSKSAIQSLPVGDGAVEIAVNRVGRLVVKPEQANAVTNHGNVFVRKNRVACGSSCAPSGENHSGTFGALVRTKDKQLCLLSCNHVIAACNHTPVGMPILSPSNADASPTERAPGTIARHDAICELRSGVPALVNPCEEDVALACITDPGLVTSWQGDAPGYDTPKTIAPPTSGMRVKKTGRTTGLTTGTVEARIGTLMNLPYKTKHFSATVWFRNVWSIRGDDDEPFALPGDSGSLVVNENGPTAVGLIFAVSATDIAFMIPMNRVSQCFGGIRLVGGHGV